MPQICHADSEGPQVFALLALGEQVRLEFQDQFFRGQSRQLQVAEQVLQWNNTLCECNQVHTSRNTKYLLQNWCVEGKPKSKCSVKTGNRERHQQLGTSQADTVVGYYELAMLRFVCVLTYKFENTHIDLEYVKTTL